MVAPPVLGEGGHPRPTDFYLQYATLYTMLVTLSLGNVLPSCTLNPLTQPFLVPEILLWHVPSLSATLKLLSFVKKAFREGNRNSLYLSHVLGIDSLPRSNCGIAQYLVFP